MRCWGIAKTLVRFDAFIGAGVTVHYPGRDDATIRGISGQRRQLGKSNVKGSAELVYAPGQGLGEWPMDEMS